ncbi:hypothetical protein Y032_0651g1156 [Ancylostoma ceylanicum]|uniref:Patched family protein n=1 Tax=Ancylostoma ceylanicum TaxID=53326 RepID=A0A016WJZ6_9BILA|nr:hypothetical protein Y032_0651g1156 [Ancylostoma ceylanicum]
MHCFSALDMSRFKDFITHDIYKAWNSGVKYHFDGNTTNITKMLYIGAYEGIKTMMDKAVLLSQCREVAAKYPEFDVVPFDTEVGMVDVVLQIPYITYVIPLFVFIGSAAVTAVLIGNLTVTLVVMISSIFIYIESYWISALTGMTLNPFSAAFLVFMAGSTIKYTIHLCHHYQQALEHEPFHDDVHRLTWTFKRILFPVTMSSIASSTVFLPMLLTNVVIFRWLAVINVYGILAGAVHAVLLTPMILALLPSNVTGSTFLCTANRKDDHVAMKTLSN